MTHYDFSLAPEVERRAREIRQGWTEDDRLARKGARPCAPLAAANPAYVREWMRQQQVLTMVVPPAPTMPPKFEPEAEPVVADEPKPNFQAKYGYSRQHKPVPKHKQDEWNAQLGATIASHVAKLLGTAALA